MRIIVYEDGYSQVLLNTVIAEVGTGQNLTDFEDLENSEV
jgi:hypothetical protein